MRVAIRSIDAMAQFGAKLAGLVRGGLVVELIGDLGAGKTTLVRALARSLGVTGPIQSPTFTISNRYQLLSGLELVHYDFYRLNEAGIMRDELAESLHDPQVITIIEWGDIVANILPADRISIIMTADGEESRVLEITARGTTHDILEKLK